MGFGYHSHGAYVTWVNGFPIPTSNPALDPLSNLWSGGDISFITVVASRVPGF
jgi:hypothetical protein